MKIKCKNENDTYKLASIVAKNLTGGEIILLNGDLGAGKTTFVKGIGKALSINEKITSPTFTLLKSYDAKKFSLVHIDAYRLENMPFEEIEDYISLDNVMFIEWSNKLSNTEFFKENLTIDIRYISKNQREFTFIANGKKYEDLVERIKQNV